MNNATILFLPRPKVDNCAVTVLYSLLNDNKSLADYHVSLVTTSSLPEIIDKTIAIFGHPNPSRSGFDTAASIRSKNFLSDTFIYGNVCFGSKILVSEEWNSLIDWVSYDDAISFCYNKSRPEHPYNLYWRKFYLEIINMVCSNSPNNTFGVLKEFIANEISDHQDDSLLLASLSSMLSSLNKKKRK